MHFKDLCLNGNCCMLAYQPAGKMSYKKCFKSQNNGAGHMTSVVWPTYQPVYYCGYIYVSLSGFLTMHPYLVLFCFLVMKPFYCMYCLFLSADCLFIVLFYVCLLLNNFIGGLLIVLFTCIVYVLCLSSGIYCWISINIVQYFCKEICLYVGLFIGLVL